MRTYTEKQFDPQKALIANSSKVAVTAPQFLMAIWFRLAGIRYRNKCINFDQGAGKFFPAFCLRDIYFLFRE